MPLIRDRCICLRITEYSETSQIVSLLSRQTGLVRAIAKGAHRKTKAGSGKFDGGMDYLELGEAVFIFDPAKEMSTLTEWTLREGHLALRQNLRSIYLALYAAELIDRLMELHDAHEIVFDRLEATIPELASNRREQAFLAFELELLRELGYLPELDVCVECARPVVTDVPSASFSIRQGGILCSDCEMVYPDRLTIDGRLARIMRGVLKLPRQSGATLRLPHLTRHQTDPINRLLAEHVQHTLGRGLNLCKWVL